MQKVFLSIILSFRHIIVYYSKIYRNVYKYLNIIQLIAQMEQSHENIQTSDYADKIERAKQLYCLYNNITFGSQEDSTKSRYILQKII